MSTIYLLTILFIRSHLNGTLHIGGQHEYDSKWIEDIRDNSRRCDSLESLTLTSSGDQYENSRCSSDLKVVPRVIIETDLKPTGKLPEAVRLLCRFLIDMRLDGYTLELPLQDWEVSFNMPR